MSGGSGPTGQHPERPVTSAASRKGLQRLREICLGFPEAAEKETWGEATFRVRDKIFAMANHGEPLSICCKAPPGAQEMLIEADPERFFRPAYVGSKGWIGVHIKKDSDWDEISGLVEESYRMTAPKRVAALLDEKKGDNDGKS